MNFEVKDIPEKIGPLLAKARQYAVLIFFVAIIAAYGFLIFQIDRLARMEPSQDEITERMRTSQRLRIDESAIRRLQLLEDQNVEVQTIFKQARDNPFSE
jgi:hypothetical protein